MTKMHPKPMQRHTATVEPVTLKVEWQDTNLVAPVHIVFAFGKATQRLVMTPAEAQTLYEELATVIRFKDTPADDIAMSDWSRFFANLRANVKG